VEQLRKRGVLDSVGVGQSQFEFHAGIQTEHATGLQKGFWGDTCPIYRVNDLQSIISQLFA